MKINKKIIKYPFSIRMAKSIGVKHKLQILLFIQIIILVVWYGSNLVLQLHTNSVRETADEMLTVNQIYKDTQEKIEEAQQISAFPVLRGSKDVAKELYRYLAENAVEQKFKSVMVNEFEEEAAEIFDLNKHISRVGMINLAGEGLILDRNTLGGAASAIKVDTDQPWVQDAIQLKGAASEAMLLDNRQIDYKNSDQYIYCVRAIVYAEQYRITGLSIVAINRKDLAKIFVSQIDENNQKLALLNSKGDVLYGKMDQTAAMSLKESQEVQKFKTSIGGRRYRVVYVCPQNGGIRVVLMTPVRTLFQYWSANTWTFYFLVMMMIIIVIKVSSDIMQSINNPLQELMRSADEYAKGNFDYKTEKISQGEFTALAKEMNHMAGSISEYIEEIYIRDIEKKENELRLLRSQVNPHFLYNALETARMKAYCNEDLEVEEILIKLSSILRYVLVKSTESVTFDQELGSIRAYLDICNVSSANPIRLETGFEPLCRRAVMPRLTLQPLVENSLKHGHLKDQAGGCITILGYVEEDGCHIKMIDNGQGTSLEMLEKLKRCLRDKKEPEETSQSSVIGLYNVHRRIQLMLGDDYGIELDSQPGRGFSVHIHVPVQ